jgi:hypothetical protein
VASKKAGFLTVNVTVDHAVEAWSGHSLGSEGSLQMTVLFAR